MMIDDKIFEGAIKGNEIQSVVTETWKDFINKIIKIFTDLAAKIAKGFNNFKEKHLLKIKFIRKMEEKIKNRKNNKTQNSTNSSDNKTDNKSDSASGSESEEKQENEDESYKNWYNVAVLKRSVDVANGWFLKTVRDLSKKIDDVDENMYDLPDGQKINLPKRVQQLNVEKMDSEKYAILSGNGDEGYSSVEEWKKNFYKNFYMQQYRDEKKPCHFTPATSDYWTGISRFCSETSITDIQKTRDGLLKTINRWKSDLEKEKNNNPSDAEYITKQINIMNKFLRDATAMFIVYVKGYEEVTAMYSRELGSFYGF